MYLSLYRPLPSIIMHERHVRKIHTTARRRRRKNNTRYSSVPLPPPSSITHARSLGIRTERAVIVRDTRRGRRGGCCGCGFLGRIPFETGFDHEVDGVSGFDGVFFEQFGVGEGFAFEEETLCVCGGCAGLGGQERFDICDGVGGADGKGYGKGGFEGLECYLNGFCECEIRGIRRRECDRCMYDATRTRADFERTNYQFDSSGACIVGLEVERSRVPAEDEDEDSPTLRSGGSGTGTFYTIRFVVIALTGSAIEGPKRKEINRASASAQR